MTKEAAAATSEASRAQSEASPQPASQATSNDVDSQPILLEPFNGFSDNVEDPLDQARVAYPKLDLPPSDTGSSYGGRQVDPDYSIELANESFNMVEDGGVNADLASRSALRHDSDNERHRPSPAKSERDSSEEPESDSDSKSASSDDSFPSLSEVWASTNASKSSSNGAVLSAIKARKPDVAPDLEYEEAMRRLDEEDDLSEDDDNHEDQQQRRHKTTQNLLDKPIEKPTSKKAAASQRKGPKPSSASYIKTEPASPGPTTRDTRPNRPTSSKPVRVTGGSPFVVPEGSQVVSLLSSSPEPELEEHYAEDSIDETYEEPDMPTGSGWVKKSRGRRGVSMPAAAGAPPREAVPKRFASSQSKQSVDTTSSSRRSSTALTSLLRAKRRL
ncbi:hypothetical protein VTK56DRAFT_4307 [Thermocarpiscus australiensis]